MCTKWWFNTTQPHSCQLTTLQSSDVLLLLLSVYTSGGFGRPIPCISAILVCLTPRGWRRCFFQGERHCFPCGAHYRSCRRRALASGGLQSPSF
ncbi:hypothetical protein CBOM_07935 [Ceraceosorus bombacis]|uniref:Uncharacterized protein n=1 Tax=Ceraceosorus bombacis TaxID=401625 RepID=A0A0P1BR57_9BASI|nr:hypothetical protein CBOM_07935 [Ceraceosorus bombacis]